jgi:hypothetical protein
MSIDNDLDCDCNALKAGTPSRCDRLNRDLSIAASSPRRPSGGRAKTLNILRREPTREAGDQILGFGTGHCGRPQFVGGNARHVWAMHVLMDGCATNLSAAPVMTRRHIGMSQMTGISSD